MNILKGTKIYNFIFRDTVVGRGTGSTVLAMPFALIPQSPISGAVAVRKLRQVYQPPQYYLYNQYIPTQGLGGLQNAIPVMQPLVNQPGTT